MFVLFSTFLLLTFYVWHLHTNIVGLIEEFLFVIYYRNFAAY